MGMRGKEAPRWRHRLRSATAMLLAAAVLIAIPVFADEGNWPRMLVVSEGVIVIYQPQLEAFRENRIDGRAAVAVTPDGTDEPVFGVVWMSARVETDYTTRLVEIVNLDVTRVKFPEATEEQQAGLARTIETQLPRFGLIISLDRLLTGLEQVEREEVAANDLMTFPPRIIFVQTPTFLVTLDGSPKQQRIEGTALERIVNSPFPIVFDPETKMYYLDGGSVWYRSIDPEASWETVDKPPPAVAALRPPGVDEAEKGVPAGDPPAAPAADLPGEGPAPEILVATVPTELIVSDGEPQWASIEGADLLFMSNTESDFLRDVASQRYFILLSGRWFFSQQLEGPWIYVPAGSLPDSFAAIPPESEMGHLRAFVAGTDEAQNAVAEHFIPQTVDIRRDAGGVEVAYDGEPRFERIEETAMAYAVNTEEAVIRIGSRYYLCHEAVWYLADAPAGPWRIADEVPDDIYTLPPRCPIYNVRYVHVFDSTPEIVSVGYYPGYLGSYVYDDSIVYGTGWEYDDWYDTYYYARPLTWGFRARWSPWNGWRQRLVHASGALDRSLGSGGWYRGNWWGVTGFNNSPHGYGRGGYYGNRAGTQTAAPGAGGGRAGTARASAARSGPAAATARATGRNGPGGRNVYGRSTNRARNAPARAAQTRRSAPAPADRPNNVYADRDGNVHRRSDGGWQTRQGNTWQQSGAAAQRRGRTAAERGGAGAQRGAAADRNRADRSRQAELDRARQARQRGDQRSRSYQQSRGSAPRSGGRR